MSFLHNFSKIDPNGRIPLNNVTTENMLIDQIFNSSKPSLVPCYNILFNPFDYCALPFCSIYPNYHHIFITSKQAETDFCLIISTLDNEIILVKRSSMIVTTLKQGYEELKCTS